MIGNALVQAAATVIQWCALPAAVGLIWVGYHAAVAAGRVLRQKGVDASAIAQAEARGYKAGYAAGHREGIIAARAEQLLVARATARAMASDPTEAEEAKEAKAGSAAA